MWSVFGIPNAATAQPPKVVVSTKQPVKSRKKLPEGITERTTSNFLLRSDLNEQDAQELLERLEKMVRLISKYYGRSNSQLIELNVVSDLDHWPPGMIPADALGHIQNRGGITFSVTEGIQNELGEKRIVRAKSVVWAAAGFGCPQHEAVHAFCHQNFGRTGPTWYAEGMAELGRFWREKEEGVQIDLPILQYLKTTKPKELADITSSSEKTGDSWQNYSWRWALCHLLSTNPNYAARFKPLGMSLLNDQKSDFDEVYGSMLKEIEFEYHFFLQHVDQGFRCDLCAWDWKSKPQRLRGSNPLQAKITANKGWQTSRVMLKRGDRVSVTASGEWSVEKGAPKLGPDGTDDGVGCLTGILFDDYKLSDPFHLGKECNYEAQRDGVLFLRCADDWNRLHDNLGTVTVKLKAAN